MGAGESVPALRDFLTMYRADPGYERDPTALVAAAEALLKLGGSADRELLLFLAEEPHTAAGLRAHVARALGETATATAARIVKLHSEGEPGRLPRTGLR